MLWQKCDNLICNEKSGTETFLLVDIRPNGRPLHENEPSYGLTPLRAKGNNVVMTQEGFSRAVKGRRSRFQRGEVVPVPNAVKQSLAFLRVVYFVCYITPCLHISHCLR